MTDKGSRRKSNQDAFLDFPEVGLWAVADGMGGHHSGDVASRVTIEHLTRYRGATSLSQIEEVLSAHIQAANRTLLDVARKSHFDDVLGTTIVALAIAGRYAALLWAGDSRIYRLRHRQLERLTTDHSLVQELKNRGRLENGRLENHPASNVITRAVGTRHELLLDKSQIELQAGDRYLLCTDGLFKELPEPEIATLLETQDLEECNENLILAAKQAGGRDNITTLLLDFHAGAEARRR